jgi:hypothetical protein
MDPLIPGIPAPAAADVVTCEDCDRPLTDHTSRLAGRGPDCRRKHGDTTARRGPAHTVDQDHLPGT